MKRNESKMETQEQLERDFHKRRTELTDTVICSSMSKPPYVLGVHKFVVSRLPLYRHEGKVVELATEPIHYRTYYRFMVSEGDNIYPEYPGWLKEYKTVKEAQIAGMEYLNKLLLENK